MKAHNHLREICQVREAAEGDTVAYLFRSRLKRMILNLNRSIAVECRLEKPVLPGIFVVPAVIPENVKQISYHCNRLAEIANTICQPSEPLDSRWRRMWKSALGHVDAIDDLLQTDN